MKASSLFIIALVFLQSPLIGSGETVADPISDFLALPIKDRYTDASEVISITRYNVDIDGDGRKETLVGHQKMWWGDNTGLYCALYSKADGRFIRLTPAESDIRLDQRFFDGRSTTFVGYINEVSCEGVLVLSNDFFPKDLMKFDSAKVYSIAADKIVITDLGAIDRTKKSGQQFYERYFGKGVESRSIEMDEFSSAQLQERGYQLPSWKPEDAETAAPTEGTLVAPSPEITTDTEAASAAAETPLVAASEVVPTPKNELESPSNPTWLIGIGIGILAAIILGIVLYVIRRKST
jgi:hypothetical protein